MENKIRVGFCRVAVNPQESVPLGGYGNMLKRYHTALLDDLCITCVAVTDEADETIIMMGLDFIHSYDEIVFDMRAAVTKATGVPEDHIYTSATHTHAGVALQMVELPEIRKYNSEIIAGTVQAAIAALEDRKPARMFTGSLETHNLNFVKHYKARDNATGEISVIGDCFGTVEGKTLLDHTTVVDPTLHILQFVREGGKDVVVANFRAHPHFNGGSQRKDASADYIGKFRTALEVMMDCDAVFFQGACGNTNSSTRLVDERRYTTAESYGLGLAAAAAECLGKYMTEVEPGKIRTKQIEVYGQINKVPDALLEKAREVAELWTQTYDFKLCSAAGAPYGVRSPYHANAMLRNLGYTKEKEGRMILNAVSIGDEFAFVTFPGEMFDSISVRMEENSPYKMTMMLGYAHHHVSYLPSMAGYKYTSYETDITRFAPGTGEMVADTYVQMLKELKK